MDDARTDGGNRRPSRRVVLVPGSEDGTPQSIQDRGLDETHRVGTQLDSPPSDVLAASERDLGAGPPRPVFDLTVDDSDGTNVGQGRGRFAVLAEEDTVEAVHSGTKMMTRDR